MFPLGLILLVFSLVCLLLSAAGVGHPRVNLQSLGLAFFVATFLIGK